MLLLSTCSNPRHIHASHHYCLNSIVDHKSTMLKVPRQRFLLLLLGIFSATSWKCSAFAPLSPLSTRSQRSVPIAVPQRPSSFLELSVGDVATSTANAVTSSRLWDYFLETLIANGVPTAFVLLTIAFFFQQATKAGNRRNKRKEDANNIVSTLYDDLYGDTQQNNNNIPMFGNFGRGPAPKPATNLGIPAKQYLQIESLNQKLDSYAFSMQAATTSKAAAAADYRNKSFGRAIASVADLPAASQQELLKAEEKLLEEASDIMGEIRTAEQALTALALDEQVGEYVLDPPVTGDNNATATAKNETNFFFGKDKQTKKQAELMDKIANLQKQVTQLELDFVKQVVEAVPKDKALGLRTALMGNVATQGTGSLLRYLQDRPLSVLLGKTGEKRNVFVTRFFGDVSASQVANLREEVTAILQAAKPGDEACVILQTGGGTVTGYGLGASQLLRLKQAGVKLTVAVEQVSASGGYMMACVADTIIASPFAVLGSIGVITEIPNVYQRLKEEGIEFQTVTAGKYKRTVTPTKKVTQEDLRKTKDDVEDILKLFKAFVGENRPQLDLETVATGETWFGTAALEKGLCDEIKPPDQVLVDYVNQGYNVYEVTYRPPPEIPQGLAGLLPATTSSSGGVGERLVQWLVRTIADAVRSELSGTSAQGRYKAQDDSSDRFQARF